ncbi:MAG: SDR family NAD(P)-dependent oxidoreductase [Deltaproteobacteria bacterium]|nr:SDR family NAD(P)-dependent oxidoreductase [Deltaproteobacteria bacterium]
MSYAGKVAVITGASRGLGKGLAEQFAAAGMKLGLCARTMSESTSDERVCRPVDVTDGEAVEDFAKHVAEHLGHIDLWINNAGVLEPVKPLRDVETNEFDEHMRINVLGVFHGCKSYIHHLRASGKGGVLINISSGAAVSAYAGWAAYCAGKSAVDRLSEVIALEEESIGLRVHAVAPGVIDTDMQELIRGTTEANFPMVDKFLELKANDDFSTTRFVAEKMMELAFAGQDEPVVVRFPPGK